MIIQNELAQSLTKYSNKTAIETVEKSILYLDLECTSNRITQCLLNLNLKKETSIGIQLENKADMISTIIGVLNAGHVFVPIDENLPANRLKLMFDDLGLAYVITDENSKCNEVFKANNLNTIIYNDIVKDTNQAKNFKRPQYDANDSIYVYFTSGTTGIPKGIIGKNCSLTQFVKWEIDHFNLTENTRYSQLISPYFDAFLRDVFVPLLSGGTICIPPGDEDFLNPEKITNWVNDNNINLIHCVPSVFKVLNDDTVNNEFYANLKYILMSGEKVVPAQLEKWFNKFGTSVQLANLYGATETTMVRSCHLITEVDAQKVRVPIGFPIADTEFLITNKNLKPCKKMMVGDLYIISNYITKGYLNNTELNAQKFITLNEGTPQEVTAFKTGDKARQQADGSIDLIGRDDRQIKLRGQRIELDEIENLLVQLDFVEKALVLKNEEEEDNLLGFVEVTNGNNNLEAIEAHLANNLPNYMIPSKLVEVDEFPLSSNGKIDQNKLKDYAQTKNIIEPADQIEEQLLKVWKEILGDKPISTDDSFLSIGGHSITVMRLVGRIYKEFKVKIPLREVFSNLTVQKQATFIKAQSQDDIYMIKNYGRKSAYHLSAVQERAYYHYEIDKDNTAYNMPVVLQIVAGSGKEKIENALNKLVSRHESLRTSFRMVDSKIVQMVDDNLNFEVEEISVTAAELDKAMDDFVRPFDLGNAPLIRAGIITTDTKEQILIVDLHHVICDGQSQQILYRELSQLLNGEELSPMKKQYKDFAEWEYNFRSTTEYVSQKEFWMKMFDGDIPQLDLPNIDAENTDHQQGGEVVFTVDQEILNPITQFLDKKGISPFSGFFSLYGLFLAQLVGQDDLVIGINTLGRTQTELENVVGMFVKTLPVRHKLQMESTLENYLSEAHKYLIEAMSRQMYDVSDIVGELNKNRSSSIETLFQTCFSFQNHIDTSVTVENSYLLPYKFEQRNSHYPLMLYVMPKDGSYSFKFDYSGNHFTRTDMDLLVVQFKSLLEKISENMDTQLIDCISTGQREELLSEDEISFNF